MIILNIDFPALLADYAGIARPNYIQGQSFREILKGHVQENWRDQMYYRYWLHQPHRPGHFGIRNHRYKLAFFYGQGLGMNGASDQATEPRWEFYDLQKDPKELHNAYGEPYYAEVISEMKKALLAEREKYGDLDVSHPEMAPILTEAFGDE